MWTIRTFAISILLVTSKLRSAESRGLILPSFPLIIKCESLISPTRIHTNLPPTMFQLEAAGEALAALFVDTFYKLQIAKSHATPLSPQEFFHEDIPDEELINNVRSALREAHLPNNNLHLELAIAHVVRSLEKLESSYHLTTDRIVFVSDFARSVRSQNRVYIERHEKDSIRIRDRQRRIRQEEATVRIRVQDFDTWYELIEKTLALSNEESSAMLVELEKMSQDAQISKFLLIPV